MPEDSFEARFATRLRAYANPAARRPTREAVAKAVAAARDQRNGFAHRLRWPTVGRGTRLWLLAACLVGAGLLGSVMAGSLVQRPDEADVSPVPTTTAGPTMAGFQAQDCSGVWVINGYAECGAGGSWTSIACAADEPIIDSGQSPVPVGPTPPGTPRPGAIAFQATGQGGTSRIALLDPTSGEVTPITPPIHELALPDSRFNPGDFFVTGLSWSPDGRALLFQLDRGPGINVSDSCGTFLVSADGTDLRRLGPISLAADYAWAPDGSGIAVARSDGSIAVLSLDGSTATELGRPEACVRVECKLQPAGWSPDGQLIAATFATSNSGGVAVASVRDGSWTILANSGWDNVVGWLPDGSVAANSFDWNGVYALHPDRPGEATLLPFNGTRAGAHDPQGVGRIDSWAPDRSHDLIVPEEPAEPIRVRDLSTGDFATIRLPGPAYQHAIPWSPDSTRLAFVIEDSLELWVVGADGSDPHRIGTAGGNVFDQPGDLAWQPIWP